MKSNLVYVDLYFIIDYYDMDINRWSAVVFFLVKQFIYDK